MSKKILKLAKTPIVCYPDYVYPLSVILNEEGSLDWFYSNFIQIYHEKDAKDSPVNFYYSDRNNRLWDTRFSLLDYQNIQKDTIDKLNIDIVDFLTTIIDTDFYCYLYLDEYYLPNSYVYEKFHFSHVEFIYGYDLDEKIFFMSGYDKSGHYNKYTYKFDDVKKAYLLCKRDYYHDKNTIYMFKYNEQGSPYHFDRNAVYMQAMEYLEARDSSVRYNHCFNQRQGMTYGVNVIMQLVKDVEEYKRKNTKEINVKSFCIMQEHKTLMILRLKYMIERGYLEGDDGCITLFEELENEYKILLHLVLKNSINQNKKILERIISKLKENYEKETIAFKKFTNLMETS